MPLVSDFLTQQGLLPYPTELRPCQPFPAAPNVHIALSATGPMLYLPFNPTKMTSSRHSAQQEEEEEEEEEDQEGDQEQSDEEERARNEDRHHNVTSHTFAIVVQIDRPTSLIPVVKVNYHTDAGVCWAGNERSRKLPFNDRFRVSNNLDWDLDLRAPNAFVPSSHAKKKKKDQSLHPPTIDDQLLGLDNLSDDDEEEEDDGYDEEDDDEEDEHDENEEDYQYNFGDYNINNDKNDPKPLRKIKIGPESTKYPIKSYVPLQPKNYVLEQGDFLSVGEPTYVENNLFAKCSPIEPTKVKAGTYIFILPVVFPLQTPESISIPNGSISHKIDIQVQLPPKRDLKAPQSAVFSTFPGHHYNSNWNNSNTVFEEETSSNNGKGSSILKKIGLRRNSNASNSSSKLAVSPPMMMSKMNNTSTNNTIMSTIDNHSSRRSSVTKQAYTDDRVVNFKYFLPVIRLPPSDATSTLNKSIYVNKVWNKSLGYEIVLPKKYTMLSSPERLLKKQHQHELEKGSNMRNGNHMQKHTVKLQLKLVPLVKGLQLKRVKVNIVEKVTYTSLSDPTTAKMNFDSNGKSSVTGNGNNHSGSSYPVDNLLSSPSKKKKNSNTNSRLKERVVPLYEIHTKPSTKKSSMKPLFAQTIKNCKNDNLLSFCYNGENNPVHVTHQQTQHATRSRASSNGIFGSKIPKFLEQTKELINESPEDVVITNPIKLDVPITFTANDDNKSIEKIWDWLNKSESFNHQDEIQFGMAVIDDLSRRNSITTMRSRVGSITSLTSDGPVLPVNINEMSNPALPVLGTPNAIIPSIITTNDQGSISSTNFSPNSHHTTEGASFLGGMFGHHHHGNHHGTNFPNQQHHNQQQQKSEEEKDAYSFFPDLSFSNLKVRHRLQLSFRVSKPDETLKNADGGPKMHHYEVIVDTPIAFISPLVDGEGDLPSYETAVGGTKVDFNITNVSSPGAEEDLMFNVSSNGTSNSGGNHSGNGSEEVVLLPSSPMMSNGFVGYTPRSLKDPPRYSPQSVSSSSIDRTSSMNRRLMVPNSGSGSSGGSNSMFKRGKHHHERQISLNSILNANSNTSSEANLDSIIYGADSNYHRNISKSSLEIERNMNVSNQPPEYDDVVLSEGIQKVGLLSDESESEGDNDNETDDDFDDDNMSLCTK